MIQQTNAVYTYKPDCLMGIIKIAERLLMIFVIPVTGGIIRFAHDPGTFLSNKPNDARSRAAYHFLYCSRN